jgi:hypothetical protein
LYLYDKKYPARKDSDFRWAALSLIYSFAILGLLIVTEKVLGLDLHCSRVLMISNSKDAISTIDARAMGSLFVGSIVVYGFMVGVRESREWLSQRYNRLSRLAPDPQRTWFKINLKRNDDWAVVYLDDNSIYMGYVSDYTFDPNMDDQDFLLSEARRVDDKLNTIYLVDGVGVYMSTRNVKRIEFLTPSVGSSNAPTDVVGLTPKLLRFSYYSILPIVLVLFFIFIPRTLLHLARQSFGVNVGASDAISQKAVSNRRGAVPTYSAYLIGRWKGAINPSDRVSIVIVDKQWIVLRYNADKVTVDTASDHYGVLKTGESKSSPSFKFDPHSGLMLFTDSNGTTVYCKD